MKTEAKPASETPYFKSLKIETVQRKYSHIINTKNVQFLKGLIKLQGKGLKDSKKVSK